MQSRYPQMNSCLSFFIRTYIFSNIKAIKSRNRMTLNDRRKLTTPFWRRARRRTFPGRFVVLCLVVLCVVLCRCTLPCTLRLFKLSRPSTRRRWTQIHFWRCDKWRLTCKLDWQIIIMLKYYLIFVIPLYISQHNIRFSAENRFKYVAYNMCEQKVKIM